MSDLQSKRFDAPDEVVSLPKVTGQVVALNDVHIGRYVHQPGWRWSQDARPLIGTPSCQHHHQGVVLSGYMEFTTDDGATRTVGPGEAFNVPPGHDGRVVGDAPCVTIEFRGVQGWGRLTTAGDRILTTLLVTDIVGSTAVAARLGDAAWKELLAAHFGRARLELDRFRGHEITTTGDGLLAVFDGTARAVQCAAAICRAAREDGIEVRAGVHSGEVERHADDLRGLAVHLATRIAALAGPGEVLLSASTAALLEGADLVLSDAGEHDLKGVTGRRRLYRFLDEPALNARRPP